jgi:hypothetical protein
MSATVSVEPLSVPRVDRTAEDAIARVAAPVTRLEVSIEERCGEQLIAAFLVSAGAWFTGREAATGR